MPFTIKPHNRFIRWGDRSEDEKALAIAVHEAVVNKAVWLLEQPAEPEYMGSFELRTQVELSECVNPSTLRVKIFEYDWGIIKSVIMDDRNTEGRWPLHIMVEFCEPDSALIIAAAEEAPVAAEHVARWGAKRIHPRFVSAMMQILYSNTKLEETHEMREYFWVPPTLTEEIVRDAIDPSIRPYVVKIVLENTSGHLFAGVVTIKFKIPEARHAHALFNRFACSDDVEYMNEIVEAERKAWSILLAGNCNGSLSFHLYASRTKLQREFRSGHIIERIRRKSKELFPGEFRNIFSYCCNNSEKFECLKRLWVTHAPILRCRLLVSTWAQAPETSSPELRVLKNLNRYQLAEVIRCVCQ